MPEIRFAANLLLLLWKTHCKAGRYLLGTKCSSFVYRRDKVLKLVSYSDADWAGNVDNRKSTSRDGFKLSDGL